MPKRLTGKKQRKKPSRSTSQSSSYIKIFYYFIIWRVAIEIIRYIASFFFAPNFQFIHSLGNWLNFDGVHYFTIITKGYIGTGLIQAFFPGFPLLTRLLNLIIQNPLWTGLLISNLASFYIIYAFYYLIRLDFSEKIAHQSIIFLLLSPASFFLIAFYSESLFLLLVLLTFILARKKKWLAAGITTALASCTRLVGIFLVPALLIELISQKKITLKNLFYISLGTLGLLSFMIFLQIKFNDPLYFFHLQKKFGAGRQEELILFPQVVWRYIKIFATARPIDWKFYTYSLEFFSAVFGLIALLLSFRKIRFSYLVFSLLALILPTFTGNFSSMNRYVIVCFPIYIFLSIIYLKKPKLKLLYLIFSSFLLIISTMLFIQGHWVG